MRMPKPSYDKADTSFPMSASAPAKTIFATITDEQRKALESYASWLHMERRLACMQLYPDYGTRAEDFIMGGNAGFHWHFSSRPDGLNWDERPQPSSRAGAVLDLVGVKWRDYECDDLPRYQDSGARPALPPGWPAVDGELLCLSSEMETLELALKSIKGDLEGPAVDQICNRQAEILCRCRELPAQTIEGIRAKARVVQLMQGLVTDPTAFPLDTDALVVSLTSDLLNEGLRLGALTDNDGPDMDDKIGNAAVTHTENAIIEGRAESLVGCLAQILLLHHVVDCLHSFVDPANANRDRDNPGAKAALGQANSMLYSIASVLEKETGLDRKLLGSEYCMPARFDPIAEGAAILETAE